MDIKMNVEHIFIRTEDLYGNALLNNFRQMGTNPVDDELSFALEYLEMDIRRNLTKKAEEAVQVTLMRRRKNEFAGKPQE
jgi:hypothetical protein